MEDSIVEIISFVDQLGTEFLWWLLVAGGVFCFAGYSCIKCCVFLLGFGGGYLIAQGLDQNAMASIFVGLVAGGIFLLLWYLVALLMGAVIGGVIGVVLALYWGIDIVIMGGVCAGVGGCITLLLWKIYLMLVTAAGGAFALIFAGRGLTEINVEHTWLAWWIVLFTVGFLVQIGVPLLLKRQKDVSSKES